MYLNQLAFFIACVMLAANATAQHNTEYFSPLSSTVYAKRITELKLRTIPVVYTEKKEQRTYADIISSRNSSIIEELEENRVIYDTMLLNKCNAIVTRIKSANPNFSFDNIAVYINRSCVANACCYGEGTLFVNAGLFLWVDDDDELALVIGHELSHQFLNHSESKIKKNIALVSSDDFINEMKAIKKSSDGKYERYKNLMKELVTQNGTHSRFKETEADSLGFILAKNAGYNVTKAAGILLKLDHVDDLFEAGNLYNVKEYFEKAVTDSFIFKTNSKYHGLSMATVTMNADKAIDSIKTHPDCVARYQKITGNAIIPQSLNCCSYLHANTNYAVIKERVLVELVRYEYEKNHLTLCAHFCLFALKNGYTSSFYKYFLSMSFSGIYAAGTKLQKFTATDARASAGSTLKQLQDFIFNANSTNTSSIAAWYLNNTADKNSDDFLFAQLMYNTQVKLPGATGLSENFKINFPDNKYTYLINP